MIITRPPRILRQVASLFLLILLLSSAIMSLARLQDPLPPWIVFSSNRDGGYRFYRMRFDGSQQKKLTHYPYYGLYPSWSSDGRWILFTSGLNGYFELYRMRSGGQDIQALPRDNSDIRDRSNGQWSPDGEWVLLQVDNYSTYRMRPNGHDLQHLTEGMVATLNPSWSPDGAQIVFNSDAGIDDGQIYIMNADGSNRQALTSLDDGFINIHPSWSPDGQWVLFISSNREENYNIYEIRPDGSEEEKILTLDRDKYGISSVGWTANKQYLILVLNLNIYRYNPATEELLRLTDIGYNHNPAPSPIIDLPWRATVMLLLSLAVLAFAIPPQALYKSLKRR